MSDINTVTTPDYIEGGENAADTIPQDKAITVKYNHEDINLSEDELKVLAQKGMNYDKIFAKLSELEKHQDEAKQGDTTPGSELSAETKALQERNSLLEQQLRKAALENAAMRLKSSTSDISFGSIGGVSYSHRGDEIYSREEFAALTKSDIAGNYDKAIRSMAYWSMK